MSTFAYDRPIGPLNEPDQVSVNYHIDSDGYLLFTIDTLSLKTIWWLNSLFNESSLDDAEWEFINLFRQTGDFDVVPDNMLPLYSGTVLCTCVASDFDDWFRLNKLEAKEALLGARYYTYDFYQIKSHLQDLKDRGYSVWRDVTSLFTFEAEAGGK